MEQQLTTLITSVNKDLSLEIPGQFSMDLLREQLAQHINHLITTDFEKLVYYLYRIDVNENKIKNLLQSNPTENAGTVIADLIIARQLEKIKSKKDFRMPDAEIDDDEKW